MAKFLVACSRGGVPLPVARIRRACARIAPPDLDPSAPRLVLRPGLALAVIGPSTAVRVHETSVCVGQMIAPEPIWWRPGAPVPEGAFALVRADDTAVELATDAVASRTVFLAVTGDLLVASSSQRAIVAVLGGFRPSAVATSWMISSGSLGPGLAWDERIARLGAQERVVLDRTAWKVSRQRRPIVFAERPLPRAKHAARLEEAVLSALDALETSGAWCVPLSGGHDSRLIATRLARRERIACVTWGARATLGDPRSDAAVARQVAARLGLPHTHFPVDPSGDATDVLDRFLVNGEGCVDHVGGYADGFALWRRLRGLGFAGVVRGDEGFGWKPVAREPDVRRSLGATILADFFPAERIRRLGLAEQEWPAELRRGAGESLASWRDRLYHGFRIPVLLAALNDLKASYVEIANPYLSRRVLEVVRELPDPLREDKRLFRALVERMTPAVPFATRSAIPALDALLAAGLAEVARRELVAGREEGSLPEGLVAHVLSALPRVDAGARPAARLRTHRVRDWIVGAARRLPPGARSLLHDLRPRPPPPGALAFRAAIVSRMARTLAVDGADVPPEERGRVSPAVGSGEPETSSAGAEGTRRSQERAPCPTS